MNNSNRIAFSIFSIFLIVALFIAMICSYFLPFGEEKVFAEVSSISTGVEYDFSYSDPFGSLDPLNWPNTYTDVPYSSCSGTVFLNGSSLLTFPSIKYVYFSRNPYPYYFFFYSDSRNYVAFAFNTVIIDNSLHLVLGDFSVRLDGSTVSDISYDDLSFIFSVYSVDNSHNPGIIFNDFMLNCLSEPAVSLLPEISFVPLTNTNLYVSDWYNSVDHQLYSHYYESIAVLCRLDNASVYTHNNINQITFKFDLLRPSGGVDVIYHSFDCAFIISSDSYAYALIMLDSKFVTDSNISGALLYYQDTSNGIYEFDSTDLTYFTSNYLLLSDYHINGSLSSYDLGYSDGMEADSTLLSVIWSTFSLPFKLLFGEYDAINDSYVGGLFNFRILGVDVRAFVLGLLSFAVILAILRLLLGAKS